MVLELHNETYQCIRETYSAYFPTLEIKLPEINPLRYYNNVDEGVERTESEYIELYSRDVIVTPKTPCVLDNVENKIDIKLCDENPHDISVSSKMEIVDYNPWTQEYGLIIPEFSAYDGLYIPNKDLRELMHYFVIIINMVNKNTSDVDCSITIKIFLDNPVYYDMDKYFNHDNILVTYLSKHAYKPSLVPNCICHLDMLGSDRCSLKKYLSTKSIHEYIKEFKKYLDDNQHKIGHQVYCDMCVVFSNIFYEPTNFNKLSDHMFDIKDKISDGEYLNMMDILMKLKNYDD